MTAERNTRQKQAVQRALCELDHPTAAQILTRVRAELSSVSLGTVYRILDSLERGGKILRIGADEAPDHFDLTAHPHGHFQCRRCGRVTDVPLPYRAEADREVERCSGGRVERHNTVFLGLCPACLAAEKSGPHAG